MQSTIAVNAKVAQAYNAAPKKVQQRVQVMLRQALQESLAPAAPTAGKLSKQETDLFARINRTLSAVQQQRLDVLKNKLEQETLTKAEHAELLQIVEAHQQLWAERLEAVIALAKLRGLAPAAMLEQLGIDPHRYA